MGRAQSIFKLAGVTYAIAATLDMMGVEVIPVSPVEWQERSKKARTNLEIKDWSMALASGVMKAYAPATAQAELNDHNICDAISIGYRFMALGLMNKD